MVTKKEVELRLKRFKDPLRKAEHIEELLKRKGFSSKSTYLGSTRIPFSKETRKALYSVLGDTYYDAFKRESYKSRDPNTLFNAAEAYAHAGDSKTTGKLLRKKFYYKDNFGVSKKDLYRHDEKKAERIGAIIDRIETGSRKKARKSLETKTTTPAIVSLIFFILGLFFLSSNFTGYTIANLTQNNSNIIGVVLFVLGIIGFFFYFRKRE